MTEYDRWWLAYCALGAGLLIKAPSFYTALGVLAVWMLVLTVLSVRFLRDAVISALPRTPKLGRIVSTGAARWETIRQGSAAPHDAPTRTDLPKVADPPAQKTYSPVAQPTPYLVPATVAARAPAETVVRVSLSGVLWTTEELIGEIARAITVAKNRNDGD